MDTMKDTKMQPATDEVIEELRNRIEAAEKERDDAKAAAENIALKLDYLRSKLETAEHAQNDWLRANAPGGWIDNLRIENEALRAKVERMEKMQAALRRHHEMAMCEGCDHSHPLTQLRLSAYQQSKLYADTVSVLEESK